MADGWTPSDDGRSVGLDLYEKNGAKVGKTWQLFTLDCEGWGFEASLGSERCSGDFGCSFDDFLALPMGGSTVAAFCGIA